MRGAQAAGMALCYGNNNGGACVMENVHPLAPNVAQSPPLLFSCPARLPHTPPPVSLSPTLLRQERCLLPQSLLSISPFLWPHKDIHSSVALKDGQNVP